MDLIANSFSAQKGCSVSCDAGVLLRRANNNFAGDPEANSLCCQEGKVTKVEAENEPPAIFRSGVREGLSSYIDYIPGQVNLDPFPYLLPDKSETRMVDKKIGAGLWMTWAIAWDEPYLWVADLEGKVSRLDSQSGEVLQSFQTTLSEPWGMTVFQGMLWINDYNKQAIFLIDPKSGKVRKRIPSPDPADGCRGMADNGKEVYLLGYATPRIYVLSAEGKLLDQFPAPSVAPWPGAAVKDPVRGGLAWDGESFWAPVGRLVRFNREGKLLDWIHGTGSEIMGLAWDGDHLWTTPRLNETWKETPRFYRVNILKAAQFASAK